MPKKKVPAQKRSAPKSAAEMFSLSPLAKKLLIAAAALIVLVILFFVVRYHAIALPVDADGAISIPEGKHWIIYNERTMANPRYLKLAEIEPGEGYVFGKSDIISDKNLPIHYFDPIDAQDNPLTYYVSAGKGYYENIPGEIREASTGLRENGVSTEPASAKLMGRDVCYFFCEGTTRSTNAANSDYQSKNLYAYVKVTGERSLVVSVEQRLAADITPNYLPDEDFLDVLAAAIPGLMF